MARNPAVVLLLFVGACGGGTPPQKVDAAPRSQAKTAPTPVAAPAGALYGFDPACDKCKRTRGEGCVSQLADAKPLGCGWVAPDGKRAAVAWVVRGGDVPHTLWWYGSDGQTKAFWTPCTTKECDPTITWSEDGTLAVVTDGAKATRYDVDAGKVTAP